MQQPRKLSHFIIIIIIIAMPPITLADHTPGADGLCGDKLEAIRVPHSILRALGHVTDQTQAARRLAPSWYGPITWARSSDTKTVNGSSKVAMTATPYAPGLDQSPAQ
jgi:hypothetical protein